VAAVRPQRIRYWILALPALAALVVFAGWKLWSHGRLAGASSTGTARNGIAVLPLVNVGGDADQQYFADGISESLIDRLSQLDGVRVIGRESSFAFRERKESSGTIAAKLGVAHLVEGKVQRVGDDVRIGVELIRAADGSTEWSRRFDRPYRDLFALQDEIALAIAGALQVKLLHNLSGAVESGRPASGNLEAYSAYLQGVYYMSGNRNVPKAIDAFSLATRLDPGYAQAWALLGGQRSWLARFLLKGDAARQAVAKAREEIDTALRLQPNLGLAHAIRADQLATDRDWFGALAELRTALPLLPQTDAAHDVASRVLATLGRVEEAIAEREKFLSSNPLSGYGHVYMARLLASIGQLDDAEAQLRRAVDAEPEPAGWYLLERAYLAILRGDAKAALATAESIAPGAYRDRAFALALRIADDGQAADAALERLVELEGQNVGGPYFAARAYALRGDADKTFEWLQRDRDVGDTAVAFALTDPLLLRFRDDPRFAEYCRQAGLPPPSASEALEFERIRAMAAVKR
jgi:TolB-like protein/Tfp pilus assembly protein PilF